MAKVYVPVRLEQEMVAAIDAMASAQGLTRSEAIRGLLEPAIESWYMCPYCGGDGNNCCKYGAAPEEDAS